MVNFNITIEPFNSTQIVPTNSADWVPELLKVTTETSDGLFGLGILVVIFFVLIITLSRQDDVYRFDFTRAVLGSGSICLILGILMIAGDLISSFRHIIWFGLIFLISLMSSYYLKQKNL